MKAILLATTAALVLLLVVTGLFRLVRIRRRAAAMLRLFLISQPFFAAAVLFTSPDLGFLPQSMIEPWWWAELTFAMLLYAAAFLGGILQLYNLADRGFSLRIIIDIAEAAGSSLTCEEIFQGYSAGNGLCWMYQKRIDGLRENGLIAADESPLRITLKGLRGARLFAWLRRFLSLETDAASKGVDSPAIRQSATVLHSGSVPGSAQQQAPAR
jgi:hypothetical protein